MATPLTPRFLRFARSLARVPHVGSTLVLAAVALGCSSSSSPTEDPPHGVAAFDGGPDSEVVDASSDTTPVDSAIDGAGDTPFDGVVTGVAPLDSGTDGADGSSDVASDGHVPPGGPLVPPELPFELLA